MCTVCLVQGRKDELQIIVLIDINQFQLDSVLNNNLMLLRYYNKTNTFLDRDTYYVDRIFYSCLISDCHSHTNDCYLHKNANTNVVFVIFVDVEVIGK